jgi:polyhydroxyalkanoate synthesis regulator phasin
MPKKKRQETEAEQTQRFRIKVKELIDAGELNPTDADAALDNLVRHTAKPKADE